MADEAKQADDASKAEPVKESKEQKTIGEVVNDKPKDTEPKMVPEAAFLELKNSNKELKKDLRDLKKLIEDGGTKGEVIDTVDSLADEYNLDKKFLGKLVASIRKDVEKEADEKISSKLGPLEARDKEERIDKVFKQHFKAAIDDMPEYAEIVNPEVIKALSLQSANQTKTFAQLIEETYGKAIPGKRTLETARPGGSRAPEGIDYDKARKDSKYFDSIMADPAMKKEYNDGLIERVKGVL